MKYEEIKRGNVTYYLTDNSVVVSVGAGQYISYNVYNSPKRSSVGDFKKALRASKPDQYATVSDQMHLARKCKLIGSGIRKPEWLK